MRPPETKNSPAVVGSACACAVSPLELVAKHRRRSVAWGEPLVDFRTMAAADDTTPGITEENGGEEGRPVAFTPIKHDDGWRRTTVSPR